MARYEYTVKTRIPGIVRAPSEGAGIGKHNRKALIELVTQMDAEGWELVAFAVVEDGAIEVVFRRPHL